MQEALRAPPPRRFQTLPNSDIPRCCSLSCSYPSPLTRYDLKVLSSLTKLPLELRQLLSSRQRAKLRAEAEGGRYSSPPALLLLSSCSPPTTSYHLQGCLPQPVGRAVGAGDRGGKEGRQAEGKAAHHDGEQE